jgi:hypothetical protein
MHYGKIRLPPKPILAIPLSNCYKTRKTLCMWSIELIYLILALQVVEINSMNISQIKNALLDLEEQTSHALENIKKRQQYVKIYFDKTAKSTTC